MTEYNPVPDRVDANDYHSGVPLLGLKVNTDIAYYAPVFAYLSEVASGASKAVEEGKKVDYLLLRLGAINNRLNAVGVKPIGNLQNLTSADFAPFYTLVEFCGNACTSITNFIADMCGYNRAEGAKIAAMVMNTYAYNHSADDMGPQILTVGILVAITIAAATTTGPLGLALTNALLLNSVIEATTGYDVLGNLASFNFNPEDWEKDPDGYRVFNAFIVLTGLGAFNKIATLSAQGASHADELDDYIRLLSKDSGISIDDIKRAANTVSKDPIAAKKVAKFFDDLKNYVENPGRAILITAIYNSSMLEDITIKQNLSFNAIPEGPLDINKDSTPLYNVKKDFPAQLDLLNTNQGILIDSQPDPGTNPPSLINLFQTNNTIGPKLIYSVDILGNKLILGLGN